MSDSVDSPVVGEGRLEGLGFESPSLSEQRIEQLEKTTEWLLQALEEDRHLLVEVVREVGGVSELLAEHRALTSPVHTAYPPTPTSAPFSSPQFFIGRSLPRSPPNLNHLMTDSAVSFIGSSVPF
eukprot:TRINITY_DN4363_c0_g1_i1.p1 TRINITY_DN4363_c0_g1~~TRINITY_DN4363_c0_g1_i1.p1  ORF type:complete len:125 (+),score=15.50 TRINITY_DN4363_c0_g1_i1:84-458(+)